jgi:hypothetical protein
MRQNISNWWLWGVHMGGLYSLCYFCDLCLELLESKILPKTAVLHTRVYVAWSLARKETHGKIYIHPSNLHKCPLMPRGKNTETHPGMLVYHSASWLAPGCQWDPSQKSSLAHSNPWGTCRAQPRGDQSSSQRPYHPNAPGLVQKPAQDAPTCLTQVWQRRHLWHGYSKRGQSPGGCCGQPSWLRSYRCCELAGEKTKGKRLSPHNHSIVEAWRDRCDLPIASQQPKASPWAQNTGKLAGPKILGLLMVSSLS